MPAGTNRLPSVCTTWLKMKTSAFLRAIRSPAVEVQPGSGRAHAASFHAQPAPEAKGHPPSEAKAGLRRAQLRPGTQYLSLCTTEVAFLQQNSCRARNSGSSSRIRLPDSSGNTQASKLCPQRPRFSQTLGTHHGLLVAFHACNPSLKTKNDYGRRHFRPDEAGVQVRKRSHKRVKDRNWRHCVGHLKRRR